MIDKKTTKANRKILLVLCLIFFEVKATIKISVAVVCGIQQTQIENSVKLQQFLFMWALVYQLDIKQFHKFSVLF